LVCVNSNGTVVARPAMLAIIFVAPAGALIAGLTNRIKKK
jgi:hypothetical protein